MKHAAAHKDLATAMGRLWMQPFGPTLDVVGVDEEVVEYDEPLQRVRRRERGRQDTQCSEANLNRPVERRDEVAGRLCRHLTHRTFPSFAS